MARCYICDYCDTIDELGDPRVGKRRHFRLDKEGRDICTVCLGHASKAKITEEEEVTLKSLDEWADEILKGEYILEDEEELYR